MLVTVPALREPTSGKQFDIYERKLNVWSGATCDTVACPENEPSRGTIAGEFRDVLGREVKSRGSVVPVPCGQVDEDLQRVGSRIGPRRLVMHGPARGLEPI